VFLVEERFDLEAGIAAVVPLRSDVPKLAETFRAESLVCHEAQRELSLASWLQCHVSALAAGPVETVEDRIWSAVVTLTPAADVVEVLQQLAADGVRMAAISNAAFSGRVLLAELRRHQLGSYFQCVVSSADLGIRKPAPAIFAAALERVEAEPDHAWFIGDTLEEDVAGALNAGLTPIWLHPTGGGGERAEHVVRLWREFAAMYNLVVGRSLHTS
jgi:HAD superfamily hydrolase (TIGR01549 family)